MTKVYAKVGRGSPFSAVRFCGGKKKRVVMSYSTAFPGLLCHLYKPHAGLFSNTKSWYAKY